MWPTDLTLVRTHLIGKDVEQGSQRAPSDLRPIAVISVWVRLWSRWHLQSMPAQVYEKFPKEITGGLPARNPQAALLRVMLRLEDRIGNPAKGPLHVLSVDASKCFERIRFAHALGAGEDFGIPRATLRGVAAFLGMVTRIFSCGAYIDTLPVEPDNGLLQGDPMSVILCNVCVWQWMQAVQSKGVETFSFIDDRTLIAEELGEMRKA